MSPYTNTGVEINLPKECKAWACADFRNHNTIECVCLKRQLDSYTANELGEPPVTIKSKNMKTNLVLLIVGIVSALSGFFLSEAFVAESFGIAEDSAKTIKLVATLVGVVLAAYNGWEAGKKATR